MKCSFRNFTIKEKKPRSAHSEIKIHQKAAQEAREKAAAELAAAQAAAKKSAQSQAEKARRVNLPRGHF